MSCSEIIPGKLSDFFLYNALMSLLLSFHELVQMQVLAEANLDIPGCC